MKRISNFFYVALASTILYETLVSSPWWTGMKTGRLDMLINLAVPSVFLLLLAYYLETKHIRLFAKLMAIFIVGLQLAVLATIYGTFSGVLA